MSDSQIYALADYLDDHSIHTDLTIEILISHKKYENISLKQYEILDNCVRCHKFFNTDSFLSKFEESLKEQYNDRGFLTPKQIECLRKNKKY